MGKSEMNASLEADSSKRFCLRRIYVTIQMVAGTQTATLSRDPSLVVMKRVLLFRLRLESKGSIFGQRLDCTANLDRQDAVW